MTIKSITNQTFFVLTLAVHLISGTCCDGAKAPHKKHLTFPDNFTAVVISAKTSATPGRLDLSRSKITKSGTAIRWEDIPHSFFEENDKDIEKLLSHSASFDIYHLDQGIRTEVRHWNKTYKEYKLPGWPGVVDTTLNAGFPIAKHKLEKIGIGKDKKCTNTRILSWLNFYI